MFLLVFADGLVFFKFRSFFAFIGQFGSTAQGFYCDLDNLSVIFFSTSIRTCSLHDIDKESGRAACILIILYPVLYVRLVAMDILMNLSALAYISAIFFYVC